MIQKPSVYSWCLIWRAAALLVASKEHKAYGVGSVQGVNNEVKDRHEGDHHQFIPGTEVATVAGSLIAIEAVHRPDHHRCRVHHCCQNVEDDHQLVKWDWKRRGHLSKGEEDDDDGKDETQGVHGHAPLQRRGVHVLFAFQGHVDETGDEGLQYLHYTGQRGEKPDVLSARAKACQDHLAGIHPETDPGHHRRTDLTVAVRAGEKRGVNDGGGQVHEAGQHRKGSGEVVPGER